MSEQVSVNENPESNGKKKRRKKVLEMPIRQILGHNLYMLKIIHRVDKRMVPVDILMRMFGAVTWFLSSTYLLRYSLNAVQEGKTFFDILWLVLLFVGLELGCDLLSTAYQYLFYQKRRFDISRAINRELFQKARSVELACYENPDYYDKFVKALGEADDRAFTVLNQVSALFGHVLRLVLSVGLLFTIHPLFLLIALVPLLGVPLRSKHQKAEFDRDMRIRQLDRKKGYPHRVFFVADYAKELRLTNMGTFLLKYLKETSEACREIHRKKGAFLTFLSMASLVMTDVLPTVLATAFAVFRTVVKKTMGYGDCLVALNATSQLSWALVHTAECFLEMQKNALYIATLREFLAYEPAIRDGDKPLPACGDLVLEDVSFRYHGCEDYTLQHISLRIGAKEKIAIVGANGAGKSTLVKLLLRLYDAEGSITYGGTDIRDVPVQDYRDLFSAVMQDYHLFALSVAENVTLARRTEGDEAGIVSALQSAGIYDKICEGGGGIQSRMTREFDKDGIMLSGGEAQKLAISHVYAKENRFVILDEPSSALDPIAEHHMYETMLSACGDCGVIFISHRLSSAVLADRIYLIDNGRVAESGTHSQLMEQDGLYAAMFRKQAENYADSPIEETCGVGEEVSV